MRLVLVTHRTLVVKLTSWAWLIGGLGSFGVALIGIIVDSRRWTAIWALVLSVLISLFCGLPLLV